MVINLIGKDAFTSITLPQKIRGQYWLYSGDMSDKERIIGVEGINNQWILKSNKHYKILSADGTVVKNTVLSELCIFVIQKDSDEKMYVFTEPVTEDRQMFTKYLVRKDTELSIGRSEGNDIVYNNKFVSSRHLKLFYRDGQWSLQDENSTNGTFVDSKRTEKAVLSAGNTVFVMGMKIIVGKSFLAINNPDGQVQISTPKIQKFVSQKVEAADPEDEYELQKPDYFYRSPRFKRDIETATFKLDSPPQSPLSEEMPWLLVMGSSLAMGAMSFVTLVSAIATGNIMSMVMGGSMLIGTVLLPTITKKYEKKRKKKKEAYRQKKYREYLDGVAVKINEECQKQIEILNENHVTVRECENRILSVDRNLWERGLGQNDFLRLRVGCGDGELDAEFSYSERKFSLDDDNLQEELYNLCERTKVLNNIPITYSLFDDYISGVIGSRSQIVEFAKGLIFQIASLYSYDEVKLVFIYDNSEEDAFEFVKWLPHVWSEDNRFRLIATNPNELKEVSAYLEKVIEARDEINEADMDDVSPYFIVFSMSKELAPKAEMLKQILAKKRNLHFSVVTFYDELRSLPKECSMVVELDGTGGKLFDKNDISGKNVVFTPDIYLSQDALSLSVRLANIPLNNLANGYVLPGMMTFLEMFGVGKVEHLNALTRWKENDPTKSLEAAVGVDTYGELFKLDLHEKFHGPHGLVAGMTGSGKSEFIITYILSLAVNYHPNEVAFVLIDYKGGGMAKSFETLPHTAGIITNLDGAAIKRSLVSIQSELKRRQAIFAQASKKIGVSNIDIYKYQKLYREGTVSEPLPHLFIISDEFAELKTQQPEFMTQLVSAARIGRSLGVHLILATQKPSGVVDDQIWSNSKFRVCLKVQERADSMDMLKRPDAAELTDTGRFYLQVGYNELFELGQSAWSGAPYYPSDRVVVDKDNGVSIIDRNGHVIKQVKPDSKHAGVKNAKKQLDVVTEYLKNIADEENIRVRPLWLEPIPAVILLDQLRKKYGIADSQKWVLNPVIGEYDDPENQKQNILRLPISQEGNAVIYGVAGSGKTSFLNVLIYSLIHEHTPEEVNLYILDFASETLRSFSKAPHVGDVILSYESEKVSNLFKMLQAEVDHRKKLFADYGGDYDSYIASSGKGMPSIVVLINNFAAFTETYEEKEEAVTFLSREGTKYGIYFVLTALGTGSVRFRLLQNFKQLLVLQLNDESDYSTVVGKTEGLFPSKNKGRGLVKRDGLYEFQVAMLTDQPVPYTFIQQECEALNQKWEGTGARKIPILPEYVDREFLSEYWNEKSVYDIPIGVEKNTLNVHLYPFGTQYITMALSQGKEYESFFSAMAEMVRTKKLLDLTVLDPNNSLPDPTAYGKALAGPDRCEEAVSNLFDTVLARNNAYKEAPDKNEAVSGFEPMFVLINSVSALRSILSDESNEKLSLILEKGSADYRIAVLIGEAVKGASSYSFEKWYKAQASNGDGIWIGSGITDQYLLKPSKTTAEMHDEITPDFGYAVRNGKCIKIKRLNQYKEESDE